MEGAAGVLSDPQQLASYHADSVELGAMAARAGVATLVLTHMIPPLGGSADKARYEADVRSGGFTGRVVVADDLETVHL
jgi:ribonuclease Z